MTAIALIVRKRFLREIACCAILTLLGVVPASAQQTDLEQQLQQLKQQYQITTRELEQRIDALERQIDKEKAAKETEAKSASQTAYSDVTFQSLEVWRTNRHHPVNDSALL
jgi:hypothetical protein